MATFKAAEVDTETTEGACGDADPHIGTGETGTVEDNSSAGEQPDDIIFIRL